MNQQLPSKMWTDASAAPAGDAASAILIRSETMLVKMVVFLGKVQSADAELLAGLLGAELWRCLIARNAESELIWYSDCQTVIAKSRVSSSSGNYWQAWYLVRNLSNITPVYLKSNERHREHQACDKASRWLRERGRNLLQQFGEGAIGRLAKTEPALAWWLVDGCEFIAQMNQLEYHQVQPAIEKKMRDIFASHPVLLKA